MHLSLLVIRSAIPDQLAQFYHQFGLTFEYHRHGNGPFHYSTHIGSTLLEIYPLAKSQEKADTTLRLGLATESFDSILETLSSSIHQQPTQTEFGLMAVLIDPEGRKIELTKKEIL